MELDPRTVKRVVRTALDEDIGLGDVTTLATVSADATGSGRIWAKQDLVVAGLPIARAVFSELDSGVRWEPEAAEGDAVPAGTTLAVVSGSLRTLLTGERVALNLLQRACGVATLARHFVQALDGTGVRIADTRKTTPGLRAVEKYAAVTGGAANHRWALDSGVLIKDNHLLAAGGVRAAVERARAHAPHLLRIEVECKRIDQVREALECGADAILLDNMRGAALREAVELVGGRAYVEVSGGVTLDTVHELALPGVDLISTGSITHSARAMDIALDLDRVRTHVSGWPVLRLLSCASTNAEAAVLGRAGEPAPIAVVAELQEEGRGRQGRQWHSPPGTGLYVSALLRPALPAAVGPRLGLVAGVAVAEALARFVDAARLEVKWPNDVLLDGRKVAGVLAEMDARGPVIEHAVIGVGVNVNAEEQDFPEELRRRATSLRIALGHPCDMEAVLGAVLERLRTAIAALEAAQGELDVEAWLAWQRRERKVRVHDGDAVYEAQAVGVLPSGALVVRRSDGSQDEIVAGDVLPVEWFD
jgi:nicotinate-nucleotide pyrophosphorylase (carboxylating)